jgi:hypothetical protein
VEKVNCDLEHLIIIDFHHNENVFETHVTTPNCFFVASHALLQPFALNVEKLRIKIGDASGQHFENIAILLFDSIQHLLHLLFLICDGNEIVQLFSRSLQHEKILSFRVLVCAVDL